MKWILPALALVVCTACDDTPPPPADALVYRDAPVQCNFEGRLYDDGAEFPVRDGCNSCKCNPYGDTPGEYQCTLIACEGQPCPNNFAEQYLCPAHCAQEPSLGVPPFWCATACGSDTECDGYKCHPDGFCVPPCNDDVACRGTFGAFDRCNESLGMCEFE